MKKSVCMILALLLILALFPAITLSVKASYDVDRWQTTSDGIQEERCTYRVWQETINRTGVSLPTNWGNAATWAVSARNAGYVVDQNPAANSIVCWSGGIEGWGHVAYVTGVDSTNVYIIEAGVKPSSSYPNYWYRETNYSRSNPNRWNGYHLEGYIHIKDMGSPTATVDRGDNGIYNVGEAVTMSVDQPFSYYVLKIYRTPTGGSTYLYWEGQVPQQYTMVFQEEGWYCCTFLGNNSVESKWVGWAVVNSIATVDRGDNGVYSIGEAVTMSVDQPFSYYVLKIYRTPTGGSTYLYWEGQVPQQYTMIFQEEGWYCCTFLGNNSVESKWVGWAVVDPIATVDRGDNGVYYVGEAVTMSVDRTYSYYVLKVYRTPTGGNTYLYWEGEVPKQYTMVFKEEGWYSCTFLGNNSVESKWVGWAVVDSCAMSHDYIYSVTKKPTTSAAGVLTGTCARCSEKTTDSLPKLSTSDYNYTITKAATCAANGTGRYTWKTTTYGTFFFDVTVPKAEHSHKDGICTRCGEKDPNYNPQVDPFRFDDVKDSSAFFFEPVYWAYGHNPQITTGTSATLFSPDKTCTRAQVVTFLWRAKGQPEPTSANNPFTDVNPDAYYYKAVLWAVEKGITNGVSATAFGPDRGCTRGQVVTFQWRANGQPEPKTRTNPFTDVKSDAYYYKAVLWAVENGITKGTSADKFSPDATCTRGQIVTFLYRDLA